MSGLPVVPRLVAVVVLAGLTLWFGWLAQAPLKGGPFRIVRLELAPDVASANVFLDAWRGFEPPSGDRFGDWVARLQTAQAWDTWLICAYAPLFALLCWCAAEHFTADFRQLAAAGRVLAALQLVAGALDFVENAGLNKMIARGVAEEPWPVIASTASGAKWVLLIAFAVYVTGAAVHWGVGLIYR